MSHHRATNLLALRSLGPQARGLVIGVAPAQQNKEDA